MAGESSDTATKSHTPAVQPEGVAARPRERERPGVQNAFHRSLRCLRSERRGPHGSVVVFSLLLLGAWSGWFWGARVAVRVVSRSARLETVTLPDHPLANGGHRGRLRIVTEVEASQAMGRIHPGDPAVMRLDGFPWAQYGLLQATVVKVGEEVRENGVRIELEIHPSATPLIPLQPGLSGAVDIEVERLSPASLALRLAGRAL